MRNLFVSTVLLFSAVCFGGLDTRLPPEIRSYLKDQGRADLVTRHQDVPRLSVAKFLSKLEGHQDDIRLLAEGYSAVVFVNRRSGTTYKISNHVFAARGLALVTQRHYSDEDVLAQWEPLFQLPFVREYLRHALQEQAFEKQDTQPFAFDLHAATLASLFFETERVFPLAVTADGLAGEMPFIDGPTLGWLTKADRVRIQHPWNMPAVWKELARWFHINERMLSVLGACNDLISPDNLIVTGMHSDPRLELIDYSMIRPNAECLTLSKTRAQPYVEFPFQDQMYTFPWTVFPEHTVSNKLWALNVSQSTALTIAYFDFAETDTYEALKKIAAFPMIPNGRSPGLDDFSIVRRVCANLLKHSPKAR